MIRISDSLDNEGEFFSILGVLPRHAAKLKCFDVCYSNHKWILNGAYSETATRHCVVLERECIVLSNGSTENPGLGESCTFSFLRCW